MKQRYAEITLKREPAGWRLLDCPKDFLELTGFCRQEIWELYGDHFMKMICCTDFPAADELFDYPDYSAPICPWAFSMACAGEKGTFPVLLQLIPEKRTGDIRHVRVHDVSFLGDQTSKMSRRILSLEESIPSGLCQVLFDDDFTIIWHNKYFLETLGYTEEQFYHEIHCKGVGYLHPEDFPNVVKKIQAAVAKGDKVVTTEMRIVLRSGEVRWLLVSFSFTDETVNNVPVLYSMGVDITDQKHARQLEMDEERLRVAMEQTSSYILEYDVAEHSLLASVGTEKFFGISGNVYNVPESLLESGVVAEESKEVLRAVYREIDNGAERSEGEICLHSRTDGPDTWFRLCMTTIRDEAGRSSKGVLLVEDITKRHQLELRYHEEEKRRVAMTYDMDFSFQIDLTTETIITAHEEKFPFFDFRASCSSAELVRKNAGFCVHPDYRAEYLRKLDAAYMLEQYENGVPEITLDFPVQRQGKEYAWCRGIVHIIREPECGHIFAYVYTRDIDEQKKREMELRRHAEQDSLTGLYNRYTVEIYCDALLKDLPSSTIAALYMLDLDNFKFLNDTYGHLRGDEMLRAAAESLRTIFGKGVLLGRLGGDELVAFQPECASQERAGQLAQAVCSALRGLDAGAGVVTVSVGLAFAPRDGATFAELYHCADDALYQAKRKGKNRWAVYTKPHDASTGPEHPLVSREWLLEESSDVIYVSDFYSYDLLYMNCNACKIYGVEKEDYYGHKCYEVLQHLNEPCPFCTNHLLCRESFFCWDYRNEYLDKSFLLRDRIVDWYGVPARIEFATDVSTMEQRNQKLQEQLEIDHVIISCLRELNSAKSFAASAEPMLRQITEFYGADRAFLLDYAPARDSLAPHCDWAREGLAHLARFAGDDAVPLDNEMKVCFQTHSVYRYTAEGEPAADAPQYHKILYSANVTSQCCAPFYINGQPAGLIGVDNPTAYLEETTVLETLGYFISEELSRSKLSESLSFLSYHDSLTGLWNRNRYVEYMEELNTTGIRALGIAVADINALKDINKLRGHTQGDMVVKRAADLLRTSFSGAHIFRLSGDEFVIFCEGVDRLAFLEQVKQTREEAPSLLAYGISVGYAWADQEINCQQLTMQATDIMMMQKREYHQHEKDLASGKHDHARLQELMANLGKGRFLMYLQPKADCSGFQLSGAEALVRFRPDENTLIPPDRFIPMLEKEHLIQYVDLFIFEEVCKLLARWKEEGKALLPVSLNFSRQTVLEPDLLKTLLALTDRYQVPKDCIEVEITESLGEYESATIAEIGAGIKSAGFRLALDDFGSHYTNMAMLSVVPADVLKLDKGLVQNVLSSHPNQLVLKSILSLCRELGISSIAEGVETQEQYDLLCILRCDAIQGYLFGRPSPVEEFEKRYLNGNGVL